MVGGGVLGTFHVFHALERGLRVLLIERHSSPRGASTRNFGQVVPSGMDPQWQVLGRESLEIYKAIQTQFDISLRQLGSIYIASNDEELTLIEELRSINQTHNYASELWTQQQCLERYPQLRPNYCQGGLFFPEEVSVNPRVMIHRLHEYVSQNPRLSTRFNTVVTQIQCSGPSGTVEARTNDGTLITAEQAVVCSGSEFKLLFPELFQQSDLQAVKLQMLRLHPQPHIKIPGNVLTGHSIRRYESFSDCPSWNKVKAAERDNTFWKEWGVHILFKQEPDGGIILGDSHEYASVHDADRLSFDLRRDINDFFIAEAQKIFDLPQWEVEAAWSGVYCQTEHPSGILNQSIDGRIHIVTGIGGKGMTSSAGYAKHNLNKIF